MEFDEIMDEAFNGHASTYTITESNLNRIAEYMAQDIMDDFSEEFRKLIKVEILKRYNALFDVMNEFRNSVESD